MAAKLDNLIEGSYRHVKGDEYVQFCIKQGMPEAEAKKTKGTTWWAHVKKGSDGVWGGWTVCEELPQYNLWMAFRDGEEKELEWVHFGEGKFMTSVTQVDNGFLVVVKGTPFGEFKWRETYTEEGMKVDIELEKLGKISEMWERVPKETGWFKYEDGDNLEEFGKAAGWGDGMGEKLKCYKLFQSGDGKNEQRTLKEILSDGHVGYAKFKFGGDATYRVEGGDPKWDRKFTFTKNSPLWETWEAFTPEGKPAEKWEIRYLPSGRIDMSGTARPSGVKGKLILKSYHEYVGVFKPVAKHGCEDFFKIMGVPADLAEKMINEEGTTLTITEEAGFVRYTNNSKYEPSDNVFRWDEQYTVKFAGVDAIVLDSWDERTGTSINVTKYGDQVIKGTCKFTDDFLIQTTEIEGTPAVAKVIFQRIG